MNNKPFFHLSSRRKFLKMTGLGAMAFGLQHVGCTGRGKPVPAVSDFDNVPDKPGTTKEWTPVSDRKIRVGLVGYGVCKFGAAFGFQNHPNVEVVAVSDLFPDRCAALAKASNVKRPILLSKNLSKIRTLKQSSVATDAASHARHAMEVLKHGKHVAVNVPAVFGSLEDADKLFEAVKKAD